MKKSRYTEEQIIGILMQHEAGVNGGMDMTEAQRLRQMEDENRRLKALVADLSLDWGALKAVIRKNGWSLPA